MKVTVIVLPESDHMNAMYTLMHRASFKEIERVVVGGHMSSVMLVITFQGDEQSFKMLTNSIYVKIDVPHSGNKSIFYSLKCLDGHICSCEEEFKDHLEKIIMNKPEIRYFENNS